MAPPLLRKPALPLPATPRVPGADEESTPAQPRVRPLANGGALVLPPQPEQIVREEFVAPANDEAAAEQERLRKEQEAEREKQARAREAQFKEEERIAELDANAKSSLANIAKLSELKKGDEDRAHAEEVKGLYTAEKQRRQEMQAAAKPTDFWEDQGAARKVLSGILIALSGGAKPGGAYTVLQDQMANDRQQKLDKFTRSKEFHELSLTDIERAKQALADKHHQIDQQQIIQQNSILGEVDALTAKMGIPKARAMFEELQAKVREKEAADEEKALQYHDKKVTETKTGKPAGGPSDKKVREQNELSVSYGGKDYTGRSKQEAHELREGVVAINSAREVADRLKALVREKGRQSNFAEAVKSFFTGDKQLSPVIMTEIGNLAEKKKGVLGALNEGDIGRFAAQFSSGLMTSPEAAEAAIDAFLAGMEGNLRAGLQTKAIMIQPPPETSAPRAGSGGARSGTGPQKRSGPVVRDPKWHAQAKKWLADPKNKNDPYYAETAKRVADMEAGL